MHEQPEIPDIKAVLLENRRLLEENNLLLKKLHRNSVRHFWFSIIWILLFLGVPLLIFYKFVVPLLNSVEQLPQSVETRLLEFGEVLHQSR